MPELTTPPPLYCDPGKATVAAPTYMVSAEKATYRAAAVRAVKLYPGPIGELIQRELYAHDEFGWILAANSLLTRVRDQILQQWREHEDAQTRAGSAVG